MNLVTPSLISQQEIPSGKYNKQHPILFENRQYQLIQGTSYLKFHERLLAAIAAVVATIFTLGIAIFTEFVIECLKDTFRGQKKVVYLACLSNFPPHLKNANQSSQTAFAMTVIGHSHYSGKTFDQSTQQAFQQALLHFDQALKLDPKCISALKERAIIYRIKNEQELELKDLNSILEINSNEVWALEKRGNIYRKKDQAKLALKDFDAIIKSNPTDIPALGMRGLIYARNEDFELALKDFNRILKINPRYAAILVNRGGVHLHKNNLELALQDFNTALLLEPQNLQALKNRAKLYQMTDNIQLAIKDFNSALLIAPHDNDLIKKLNNLSNKPINSSK